MACRKRPQGTPPRIGQPVSAGRAAKPQFHAHRATIMDRERGSGRPVHPTISIASMAGTSRARSSFPADHDCDLKRGGDGTGAPRRSSFRPEIQPLVAARFPTSTPPWIPAQTRLASAKLARRAWRASAGAEFWRGGLGSRSKGAGGAIFHLARPR